MPRTSMQTQAHQWSPSCKLGNHGCVYVCNGTFALIDKTEVVERKNAYYEKNM